MTTSRTVSPDLQVLASPAFGYVACSVLACLLSAGAAQAATVTASSTAQVDVQLAIDRAANGDTVIVPAGNVTWATDVVIPNTKGITLNGSGTTINGRFLLNQGPSGSSRITGFNFVTPIRTRYHANDIKVGTSDGYPPFRIDNNTFTSNDSGSVLIDIWGGGPGLIDHNTLHSPGNSEMIHNNGYSNDLSERYKGWLDDVIPGSANAIYIENNVFKNINLTADAAGTYQAGASAAVQNYRGARMVFRYNQLTMTHVDVHGGNADLVGGRWWEVYENDYFIVANGNLADIMALRGGSGVAFNNRVNGTTRWGSTPGIVMREEDSGAYPEMYQLGRGKGQAPDAANQALVPAYFWNNGKSGVGVTQGTTYIQIGRDYYESQKPGYTSFTYPYPLNANGLPDPTGSSTPVADTQAPSVPSGLAASVMSSSQINLAWTASTDNVGVTGYRVFRNGSQVGTATATNFNVGGLTPATAYAFTIAAYDAAGNVSAVSASVSATIPATVPTAPTAVEEVLPAERRIAWNPGVPGGIPARTTIFANVRTNYGAVGDGVADDRQAIQNAINACPVGQVVYIPAGTYRLNSHLDISKSIVLRGAGPSATKLKTYAPMHGIVVGNYPSPPAPTNVIGSPVKGATTLTVASTSTPPLTVGDTIVIDQINDNSEVFNVDSPSREGGARTLSQMTRVAAVSGQTVTIDPPLYHAYVAAFTPQVWKINQNIAMTVNAGVEDLGIERVSPTGTEGYNNIKLIACDSCWVKNVESKMAQFRHVDIDRSRRCEVRGSFFNDGMHHGTGGFAYGVVAGNRSSDNLIEDNVFYHLRHSMVIIDGAAGNVFGYNYSAASYQGVNWLATDLNSHGAHTHMNLFEGNVVARIRADYTHGSSSYNTCFRNHSVRESSALNVTSALRAVDIKTKQIYWSFLGNVLGKPGQSWTAYEDSGTRTSTGQYAYTWGYPSDGSNSGVDPRPKATALRHGNFDYATNSVKWDPAIAARALPASLYRQSKPAFFGSLPWPSIGPDCSPLSGMLPAKNRYEGVTVVQDTQAPSVPVDTFRARPASSSEIDLTWDPSSDNVGVTGYLVYRGGVQIATATGTTYRDSGLAPSTNYIYTLAARDAAGNVSGRSGATSATTFAVTSSAGSGTGLAATYYDNADFTGATVQRIDATVGFDWGEGAPLAGIGADTFSVRWQGQVQAQHSQTYTFFVTGDDGVRLWVNGQLLVNQWKDQGPSEYSGSIALTTGQKYNLVLEYYENGGGATAKLAWMCASTAKQIIPASQLFPVATPPASSSGTGLAATYYDNADFSGASVQRLDAMVDFDWGGGAPMANIGVDTFSVRWLGQVQAQHSQPYTFFVTGDDGIRLRVNGQLLVDQWKDQGASEYSGSIALTAGQKYDLVLEYYENGGGAVAKLAWSSASTAKQIIPMSHLYPVAQAPAGFPAGWAARDVGNVGSAGATAYNNGTFTVTGSGEDIWNSADSFHFASQPLTGDGSIVARVVSVQNTDGWAKAGVMIREGIAAGAKHAFCCVTPGSGVSFQRRTAIDGGSEHTTVGGISAPRWVKLVRQGAMVTGYESADGVAWTVVGSQTISLTNPVQIGLAVTSHNNGARCTAVIDKVVVTPSSSG